MKKYGIIYIKLYPTCNEKILKSCKSVFLSFLIKTLQYRCKYGKVSNIIILWSMYEIIHIYHSSFTFIIIFIEKMKAYLVNYCWCWLE